MRKEKAPQLIWSFQIYGGADVDYYLNGAKILKLAENAYSQYLEQSNEERRRLLDFVISKCTVKDDVFTSEFRQSFDLLALYKIKEAENKRKTGSVSPVHRLWRSQYYSPQSFAEFNFEIRIGYSMTSARRWKTIK